MSYQWYIIDGVNPEPWAASQASIGKRNGKMIPHFHKPEQLRQYQESVKDLFPEQNPHFTKLEGEIELIFYFWRQLPIYEVGEGKSTRQAAQADATNMQKALEDALQGILYENDKDVRSVRSVIVAQGNECSPCILICAGTYADSEELDTVQDVRRTLAIPKPEATSNIRDIDVTDIF